MVMEEASRDRLRPRPPVHTPTTQSSAPHSPQALGGGQGASQRQICPAAQIFNISRQSSKDGNAFVQSLHL